MKACNKTITFQHENQRENKLKEETDRQPTP